MRHQDLDDLLCVAEFLEQTKGSVTLGDEAAKNLARAIRAIYPWFVSDKMLDKACLAYWATDTFPVGAKPDQELRHRQRMRDALIAALRGQKS